MLELRRPVSRLGYAVPIRRRMGRTAPAPEEWSLGGYTILQVLRPCDTSYFLQPPPPRAPALLQIAEQGRLGDVKLFHQGFDRHPSGTLGPQRTHLPSGELELSYWQA